MQTATKKKPGRPARKPGEGRSRARGVTFTDAEWAEVERLATRRGVGIYEWVRARALMTRPKKISQS